MNDWKVTTIQVRDRGEWGTFFVRESPVLPREGGGVNASAEWTCNSSFGVFGHYWSSMGEPFAEFIKGVDRDYLLGKIAGGRVSDERETIKKIRAEIRSLRKRRQITADQARAAVDSLDSLVSEHTGEILFHELYMDDAISEIGIELGECVAMRWPDQAEAFAKRLWPLFVEQFRAGCQVTSDQ